MPAGVSVLPILHPQLKALAGEVASYLGMDLGKIKIKRFADGEIYVQVRARAENCCSPGGPA
jgi:phosphoribosylpyrophosphate synthetase